MNQIKALGLVEHIEETGIDFCYTYSMVMKTGPVDSWHWKHKSVIKVKSVICQSEMTWRASSLSSQPHPESVSVLLLLLFFLPP